MRVQHNIMAMNAYRNYNNNVKAIAKNLEKLSSGYRINRAGDDAAGLAISEKMRAQITGLATAQKNAKDGISLIQTAEGALTEVHSMLNRMFELAEQSANGTYDNEVDRANLQKEFDALRSEIDRIADSSNFNGKKLLDGSLSNTTKIENGAITQAYTENGTGSASGIKLPEIGKAHKADTILSGKSTEATVTSFQIDLGNLTFEDKEADLASEADGIAIKIGDYFSNITLGDIGDGDAGLSNADIMAAIKALDGSTVKLSEAADFDIANKDVFEFKISVDEKGIMTLTQTDTATQDGGGFGHFEIGSGLALSFADEDGVDLDSNLVTLEPTSFNQNTVNNVQGTEEIPAQRANTFFTLDATIVKDGGQLKIGDTTYTFAVGAESKFAGGKNVIDLSSMEADDANLIAEAGKLLSQQNNSVFTIGFDGTDKISFEERDGQAVMDLSTEAGIEAAFGTGTATFVQASGSALTLQIGDTAENFNMLKVDVADMHVKALGIDAGKINISEQGMAQSAMDAIKNAINSVSSTRGDLGALQNRLDHTINNLSVMQENIQDAESTIRDTDVAAEMMAYTKNNILIQSAQAMLAQANQIPQGVLQLMG